MVVINRYKFKPYVVLDIILYLLSSVCALGKDFFYLVVIAKCPTPFFIRTERPHPLQGGEQYISNIILACDDGVY